MKKNNTNTKNELEFELNEVELCVESNPIINEEDGLLVKRSVEIEEYKKGDIILKAGEIQRKSYSILSGCVRQYYIKNGEEKTTFFFTEDQSIYSINALSRKAPSKHYLSCVEDTKVTSITDKKKNELLNKIPQLEPLSRMELEQELQHYQEMMSMFVSSTPEERYLNLVETRPDLLERVPQYHLASYLGVKPESLSRIRKRILKK